MTLTYNRKDLIERLVTAIHTAKRREEDRAKEATAKFEEAKAAWSNRHAADWIAALPKIRARLKRGAPIRSEDLPQAVERYSNYTRPALFDETHRESDITPPRELAILLSALWTIENESVTPNQLSSVIGASDFRAALRSLGFYEGLSV